MTDRSAGSRRTRQLRTARLEAFSDGVFAIAITLLVLELAVPIAGTQGLLTAAREEWPSYLAYAISFATVGAFWLAHSTISEYLTSADPIFVRLNLVLLFVISFLPFPTKVVATYVHQERAERVAVTIYGVTVLVGLLLILGLWQYALRAGLVQVDVGEIDERLLTRRMVPAAVAYALLLVLGLLAPTSAALGYLAVAVFLIFPFGAVRAHRGDAGDGERGAS